MKDRMRTNKGIKIRISRGVGNVFKTTKDIDGGWLSGFKKVNTVEELYNDRNDEK